MDLLRLVQMCSAARLRGEMFWYSALVRGGLRRFLRASYPSGRAMEARAPSVSRVAAIES